jgi:2-methylcitrate dehydratase PrpD
VAIVEGAAGEKQFSDRAVQDPTIVALRTRVVPALDPAVKPEQVEMSITLKDGRQLEKAIQHAIGSLEAPMTDHDLETKFTDLAEGILTSEQIRKLISLCWSVEKLSNAGDLAKAAVPVDPRIAEQPQAKPKATANGSDFANLKTNRRRIGRLRRTGYE